MEAAAVKISCYKEEISIMIPYRKAHPMKEEKEDFEKDFEKAHRLLFNTRSDKELFADGAVEYMNSLQRYSISELNKTKIIAAFSGYKMDTVCFQVVIILKIGVFQIPCELKFMQLPKQYDRDYRKGELRPWKNYIEKGRKLDNPIIKKLDYAHLNGVLRRYYTQKTQAIKNIFSKVKKECERLYSKYALDKPENGLQPESFVDIMCIGNPTKERKMLSGWDEGKFTIFRKSRLYGYLEQYTYKNSPFLIMK